MTTKNTLSFGKGSRNLVVIPGLSITKVTSGQILFLKKTFKVFTDRYRVTLIEPADEIPDGYTIEDLAEDTAETMQSMGIERADIMGVSQGGMIAQHLTISHPDMVDKLVLVSTISRPNDTASTVLTQLAALAEEEKYEELNREFMKKLYCEDFRKKNRLVLGAMIKTVKPDNKKRFINLIKACGSVHSFSSLKNITCPTLVIGDRDDEITTGAASEEIAEEIEGSRLQMYEGFGHGVYDEYPDFYPYVNSFLTEE